MEPNVAELSKSLAETRELVLSGQTALNIVWTLVTGFLVMFMQAGFALVETGLTRAKNVAHTMGMNFLVYAIGIIGFWALGFGLQMGGRGRAVAPSATTPRCPASSSSTSAARRSASSACKGFFLVARGLHARRSRRCSCSRWCSWTPTATIPTGAMAERWKFTSFVIFSFVISTIIYPIYAQLGLGRRLARRSWARTSGSGTATSTSRAARWCTWWAAWRRSSAPR